MSKHKELVLWGFHVRYSGPAGVVPIKLFAGTRQQVNSARTEYVKRGGWTLGIYAKFDEPLGLRVQCNAAHGTPRVEFPTAEKVAA